MSSVAKWHEITAQFFFYYPLPFLFTQTIFFRKNEPSVRRLKSDAITDIKTHPRPIQTYVYHCRPIIFCINRNFEITINCPHALLYMPLHCLLLFQNMEWNISCFNFGFSINNTSFSMKLQVKAIELAVLYFIFSFAEMKLLCLPSG